MESLEFLNDMRINYELCKKFIIMRNKNYHN